MNKTDHNLFERTKDISYEDILLDCDNLSMDQNPINRDDLKLEHMKANVMKQVGVSKTKRTAVKALLIASFVLIFLTTALSPFGRNTFAEILNKLYFIPGVGKAGIGDTESVYILPKPMIYKSENGTITIRTITKIADTMIIDVTSNVYLNKDSISIVDKNLEYESSHTMLGQGENSTGRYEFKIPSESDSYRMKLFDQYTIPFTLVEAESFDNYEEMGPTYRSNNFGLTLIPFRFNNQIQFEMIQHNTNQGTVALYGSYNKEMEDNISINILDNNDQTYVVDYPKSHIGLQSSFTFTPMKEATSFTVNIPVITLKYELNSEWKIPMPKEGITEVNQTIDMQGFKVDITKIVRNNDKITVYVDTHYDLSIPENICYFMIDMDKMSLDYYHWLMNEQDAIEGFEFYINPKEKNLTINFNELYTTMKGSWKFQIKDLK